MATVLHCLGRTIWASFKEVKCRAKKLLNYRDAHKQLFYDAVKGAKALPFYPLAVRSYGIFVCTDEEFAPLSGYEVAFKRDRLYFALQSGSAILASFDALRYSFDKLKNDECELSHECQSGAAGKNKNLIPRSSSACKSAPTSFAPWG